jgi:nucleoside-diphosphate-sugar epimerase
LSATDPLHEPAGRPLLIVGCGDSGLRLARRWRAAGGGEVLGLRRDTAAIDALAEPGIRGWPLDLDAADALPSLPAEFDDSAALVWLAPPPREGREDSRLRHLPALLERLRPQRLVLASTTGVYGPGDAGRWTSEDSPIQPDTDRAHRRVDAEQRAVAAAGTAGVALARLRIAAIYGPGRLPLGRLREGRPLSTEMAARPGNRIHVDDLVEALFLAALRAPDGAVYNVADGCPAPFGDYLDACADALGLPRLPRDDQSVPDPAADFLRAGRRIAADRIRRELELVLHYPDFRRGIPASLPAGAG